MTNYVTNHSHRNVLSLWLSKLNNNYPGECSQNLCGHYLFGDCSIHKVVVVIPNSVLVAFSRVVFHIYRCQISFVFPVTYINHEQLINYGRHMQIMCKLVMKCHG